MIGSKSNLDIPNLLEDQIVLYCSPQPLGCSHKSLPLSHKPLGDSHKSLFPHIAVVGGEKMLEGNFLWL